MNIKTHQEMIDEIMDSFDFTKVYQVMKALNWRWYDKGIPDNKALRQSARILLKKVLENKSNLSCGGFFADFDDGILELKFVVAQLEVYEEEVGKEWGKAISLSKK